MSRQENPPQQLSIKAMLEQSADNVLWYWKLRSALPIGQLQSGLRQLERHLAVVSQQGSAFEETVHALEQTPELQRIAEVIRRSLEIIIQRLEKEPGLAVDPPALQRLYQQDKAGLYDTQGALREIRTAEDIPQLNDNLLPQWFAFTDTQLKAFEEFIKEKRGQPPFPPSSS